MKRELSVAVRSSRTFSLCLSLSLWFGVLATTSAAFADRAASLDTARESLQARMALIASPETKKIDILTFTLKEDAVGLLLLNELVKKAQSGAQVRLGYDAFSSKITVQTARYVRSQGVDLRVFRPLIMDWERPFQSLMSMIGYNNRAHQKIIIVNDAISIVGSANYSEDYFLTLRQREARKRWTFKDRELLIEGPSVANMSTDFESRWDTGDFVSPIEERHLAKSQIRRLQERFEKKVATRIREGFEVGEFEWPEKSYKIPGGIEYVADDISGISKETEVHDAIIRLIRSAQAELIIETPYLVMPGDLFRELENAVERGVRVQVLTNRPDGSDEGDVGEMSKKEIARLSKIGVEVSFYELFHVFHGKLLVADGHRIYWGSYNLDMRSKHFNLENGVLFDSREIALDLEKKRVYEGFESKSIQIGKGHMNVEARIFQCREIFSASAKVISTKVSPAVLIKRPLL